MRNEVFKHKTISYHNAKVRNKQFKIEDWCLENQK